MSAWITASISIRSASAPATASMAPYSPWNQLAVRSGLVVPLTTSPTFPVTHTAASVTHSVTPRITNSPAADAAPLTALVTASQTLPTTGSWHGLGIDTGSACAGAASGPISVDAQRRSARAAPAQRKDTDCSRHCTTETPRSGGLLRKARRATLESRRLRAAEWDLRSYG